MEAQLHFATEAHLALLGASLPTSLAQVVQMIHFLIV